LRSNTGISGRLFMAGTIGVLSLLASAACSGGSSTAAATGGGGGGQGSSASVTISEKLGPPDSYSFSPDTITVSSGQSLSVVNKSDEEHKLACTPDPGISSSSMMIEKSSTGSLTFAKAGTFSCTSSTHPEAKLTVTVS
jgi:plastocyanin